MDKNKIIGISIDALLLVVGIFWLGHHLGATSDSTVALKNLRARIERLQNDLTAAEKKRVDDCAQRDAEYETNVKRLAMDHAKEIADKNAEIERRENEYKRVLAEKESDIEELNRMVDKFEGLYRTRTVVCIALGTAVVVALFVGTLMGAKGRRDALRVCKERNTPAEEVV